MTTYGIDFYGTNTYGKPRLLEFDATPFIATSYAPGVAKLTWTPPEGAWDTIRLLRSGFGHPVNFDDGQVLLEVAKEGAPKRFIDENIATGRFYYWSLFVRDATGTWWRAGDTQVLSLKQHGYETRMLELLPEHHIVADRLLAEPDNTGPLERFMSLFGLGFNLTRTELESLHWIRDPERVAGGLLPLASADLGIEYEPKIGMRQMRVWLRNAVHLYKTKGTRPGIEGAASAITGWGAEATYDGTINIKLYADRVNRVANPSFEVNVSNWSGENQAALTRVTSQSVVGAASGQIQKSSGSGDMNIVATSTPVTPGSVYSCQAQLRPNTTARDVKVGVRWLTSGLATISDEYGDAATEVGGSWVRPTALLAAPSNAAHAQMIVAVEGAATSEAHFVDAVLLEKATDTRAYFDGSLLGGDYMWEGSPHESNSHLYVNRTSRNARLGDLMEQYVPLGETWFLNYADGTFSF